MHEKWIVKTTGGLYVESYSLECAYDPVTNIKLTNILELSKHIHSKAAALDIAIRIGGVCERV